MIPPRFSPFSSTAPGIWVMRHRSKKSGLNLADWERERPGNHCSCTLAPKSVPLLMQPPTEASHMCSWRLHRFIFMRHHPLCHPSNHIMILRSFKWHPSDCIQIMSSTARSHNLYVVWHINIVCYACAIRIHPQMDKLPYTYALPSPGPDAYLAFFLFQQQCSANLTSFNPYPFPGFLEELE